MSLTFDDITELVSAQRNSAWADIARRIAHEIKNPLTPIQLSAERLKRKYGRQIQTDKQIFDQCTDTIIRQVGDIGRMVDEFSSFARMPKAVLELQELAAVVREATVLQRVSSADIDIELDVRGGEFIFPFDRRLITQAITNLVKNAREAIEAAPAATPEPRGRILVEAGVERRPPVHPGHRQRHRPAERKPPPAGRTLYDDPRKGHRPRACHRQAHHGRTWRAPAAGGCARRSTRASGARMTLLFDKLAAASRRSPHE